jgi:hypothetical protein
MIAEETMEKPNPRNMMTHSRRIHNTMNKVLKAFNKTHNLDLNDEYKRNENTYNFLKDIEILHPTVTKALQEEKDLFFKILEEIAEYKCVNFSCLEEVRVGYWWYLIVGKSESINLPTGPCKIVVREDSKESIVYIEGGDDPYSYTIDRDNIYFS